MKRRTPWTRDFLAPIVASTFSVAGTLRALGLRVAGANYAAVNRAIAQYSLETSHWTRQGHWRGRSNPHVRRIPLKMVLVTNSTYNSNRLRQRLLREGALQHRCATCHRRGWQGRPIPLELDHIDGDRTNNTLANLRLLCPNCHALTPTYRGRNIARTKTVGARKADNGVPCPGGEIG